MQKNEKKNEKKNLKERKSSTQKKIGQINGPAN